MSALSLPPKPDIGRNPFLLKIFNGKDCSSWRDSSSPNATVLAFQMLLLNVGTEIISLEYPPESFRITTPSLLLPNSFLEADKRRLMSDRLNCR
jgi:hypothetical protein